MIEATQNQRDRRIQPRYSVDLHAKVRGRNQLPTNCRVRNICNGGMLLETAYDEPQLPFQSGDHIDIHFDLPDAQSMDPVQAVIEIAHRTDRGLGARFVRLLSDGRVRLARFIGEKVAENRPAATACDKNPVHLRAREVLAQVGEQRLGGMLDSLFETLVEELWAHTERAGSDAERTQLSSEIAMLARAIHGEDLPERLRTRLIESLGNIGKGPPEDEQTSATKNPAVEFSKDGLQLVDQEEFEIWLAKSELANRLEDTLREPLDALRTLIAACFDDAALPMEPMALAEALEQTLDELGLGIPLQRIALQVVADHLSRNLGSFYREILRAWTAAGLPELASQFNTRVDQDHTDPSAPSMAGSAAATEARTIEEPGQQPPMSEETPAAQQQGGAPAQTITQAADIMASILSNYPPQPFPAALDRRGRVYTGGRRVADMLAALPADYPMPDPASKQPLRELVQQWLQAAAGKDKRGQPGEAPAMAPQVEERVDLTDRLLALMLSDTAAPQQMKSLIKPLTRRFLSMAVTEQGAITNAKLPLISLINRLEQLASYLQGGDASSENIQKEFEAALKTLSATQGNDRKTIDEISKKLGDLETRAGREYRDNISSWVSICESKERDRLAREQVREQLNTAFSGHRVHSVLLELLEIGWRNLLDLVCANSGLDHARWHAHWNTLCALHTLTLGTGEAQAHELPSLDVLIEALRAGLTFMGIDPVIGDELLERIENAVRRASVGLERHDDYLTFVALGREPESEPDRVPQDLTAADWEQGLADVNSLSIGSLIWMRAKESNKALRLIWRNEDGTRLAVTDTMGKKVKVLRRNRLAEAFVRGQAHAQAPTGKRIVTRAADAALSEMQERLKYHETHDPLTGLSNQRRLLGSLTQLLLSDNPSNALHALGFLELDRYDTLTGTYGYSVGERMLMSVSKLLEGVAPDARCLAYMGGSRFGVLMPVMDLDHATEIGESIQAGLNVMPFELQGKPFGISGSLGLALFSGADQNPEKLVSAASVACLAAQREGGDRVVVFSETNDVIARQLEYMRGGVQAEDIIKAGRRKLRYQRIVPIDPLSGLRPHCEILLSVYDETGMPLPLQSFIAAAEAFNMMREVDRQVIDAAFRWVQNSPNQVSELGGVAINLSGQSLTDPGLLTYIQEALKTYEIPVELISFEVTETAAIVSLDQAAIILDDIKSLGCEIALDDFGSGMSSYSYLKRLPVDYVKIDGSFVKDILVSPQDREIVKSFNEIAHFMGKKTIAEYVENQEILELLRDIGVDYAQGYAIEKPKFIEDLQ